MLICALLIFSSVSNLGILLIIHSFIVHMAASCGWALSDDCIQIFALLGELDTGVFLISHVTRTLFFLPVLSNTLPIVDELCKRSARFITSCLLSSNRLVRSITRHSVVFSKYNSLLGNNALVCCSRYGWSSDSFLSFTT